MAKRKKVEQKEPKKRHFILCTCGAKSKILCSEFGGLQTRRCRNGHIFEYDKWMADRMVWGALMNPAALPAIAKGIRKRVT